MSIAPLDAATPLPLGQALVAAGLIDEQQLEWGLARQQRTGERLGRILVNVEAVHRLDLQRVLGETWGLPFVDLFDYDHDAELTGRCTPDTLLAEGWFPLQQIGDRLVVATSEPPSPALHEAIHRQLGDELTIELRTTTPMDIERAVTNAYRDELVQRSTAGLKTRRPEQSAATGLSRFQKITFGLFAVVAIVGGIVDWRFWLSGLILFANIVFFGAIVFKLTCVLAGIGSRMTLKASAVERNDRDLPVYTVLVPVYREANVVADLIANLGALDYPEEKLEVLVLLEADDHETIAAARAARPPSSVRLVIVPDAAPKTKPKACNVGLTLARGELLVIYDAEDRPDPDQLRKAVAAFREAGPRTVCVQARLRYWNASANLLTRMFGLEYGYWFGAMLPGLDRLRMPIPLGGTSNHFRIGALRELGGWDPHNVTEDADLGLRAAVEGYRVGVIDSSTDEEACGELRAWIRQRTRWIKGYMQTALVHTRHPVQLLRDVGPLDALGFLLLIAGTPLTFLLAPLLWAGTASWYAFGEPHLPLVNNGIFWMIAMIDLIAGNVIMIGLNMIAAVHDRGWRWAPFAVLNPFYWVLHSWASWRALIQLIRNPFYWEKTPHGLPTAVCDEEPGEGIAFARPAAV
ncbi:MAG: glycosyltransferase [Solirubrobacterales bacterium]|nr:glycosyltransferase [Solirubrobacterales bacterium]